MHADVFARSATFRDFDAFAAAIEGTGGSVIPMAAGPWRATLSLVGLGDLVLYRGDVPPQIRRGATVPGDAVLLSRAAPGSVLHQGHAFRPGEIVMLGARAPVDTNFRQPAVWSGVQFAPGRLAAFGEGWGLHVPGPGRHAILDLGETACAPLMATVEAAIAKATGSAALMASPAGRAGLRESVEVAVQRALAGPLAWVEQPRATFQHLRIVSAANELLADGPGPLRTVADLAAALQVAPRTLHRAFAAVYGCSPLTHLKRWRLTRVRSALLAQEGGAPLVKTAALDQGFWHLGRFAQDYRAMFGEHPSETRRGPG